MDWNRWMEELETQVKKEVFKNPSRGWQSKSDDNMREFGKELVVRFLKLDAYIYFFPIASFDEKDIETLQKIKEVSLAFLEKKQYKGFLRFVCGDDKEVCPIGENARSVAELKGYMMSLFHPVYDHEYISYSLKKNHGAYRVITPKIGEEYVLGVETGRRRLEIFRTKEEILEQHEWMKNETEKLETYMEELAKKTAATNKDCLYEEEKECLLLFNQRIPIYGYVTFDRKYRARLFFQTATEKDFDKFKQRLEKIATEYIKKNRLKKIMNGDVFTPNQKFYYQIFQKHTKVAERMLLKKVMTSLSAKELYALIETEVEKEIVPLNEETVLAYKKTHKIRHQLQSGFVLGNLIVYRGKDIAFVEKN